MPVIEGRPSSTSPPYAFVEIIYLQEKGRIPGEMKAVLDGELAEGGVPALSSTRDTKTVIRALLAGMTIRTKPGGFKAISRWLSPR